MSPAFARLVSLSVWLLFAKGLLLVPVTVYTFGRAYRGGEPTPVAGIAACAAGTFALVSSCVAARIRKDLG